MFKIFKFVAVFVVVFVVSIAVPGSFAFAQEQSQVMDISQQLDKVPNTKAGSVYWVTDKEAVGMATFDVLGWKKLKIEAGGTNDAFTAVISYPLINLKKDFNVQLPILDLINCRIGVAGGYRLDKPAYKKRWPWGFSATFIEIKF